MHYLVTLWDGGGTVPAEIGVARRLVQRGHTVTVLVDPTVEADAKAPAPRSAAGGGLRIAGRPPLRTICSATGSAAARSRSSIDFATG